MEVQKSKKYCLSKITLLEFKHNDQPLSGNKLEKPRTILFLMMN
jgi:hypothetical protein